MCNSPTSPAGVSVAQLWKSQARINGGIEKVKCINFMVTILLDEING